MTQRCETRPRGGAARSGFLDLSFDGDTPSNSPSRSPRQSILAPLRRKVAEGCFRLAALKLIHAADNVAIGDDLAAWPNIDCAEFHYTEGASLLREEEGAA